VVVLPDRHLRRQNHVAAPMTRADAITTPTAMPAFAPVDNPPPCDETTEIPDPVGMGADVVGARVQMAWLLDTAHVYPAPQHPVVVVEAIPGPLPPPPTTTEHVESPWREQPEGIMVATVGPAGEDVLDVP
jgi:hypothetical protein